MNKRRLFVLTNAVAAVTSYRHRAHPLFTIKRLSPPLSVYVEPISSSGNGTDVATPLLSAPPRARDDRHRRNGASGGPLPVTYTNDPRTVDRWLRLHCRSLDRSGDATTTTLGFDVESVPNAHWLKDRTAFEGPATVQLATTDDCLVVHLTRDRGGAVRADLVAALCGVLSDPAVLKVGRGVDDDMVELSRLDRGLTGGTGAGRVDLGVGLARAARVALGLDLSKARSVSRSDWSRTPLKRRQIDYCARDAWAGAAVFHALRADADRVRRELERRERPIGEVWRRRTLRTRAKRRRKQLLRDRDKRVLPSTRRQLNHLELVLKEAERAERRFVFEDELANQFDALETMLK